MATEFCQRCKQSHAGRICDYDDGGECAETRAGESEAVVLDEQDPANCERLLSEALLRPASGSEPLLGHN